MNAICAPDKRDHFTSLNFSSCKCIISNSSSDHFSNVCLLLPLFFIMFHFLIFFGHVLIIFLLIVLKKVLLNMQNLTSLDISQCCPYDQFFSLLKPSSSSSSPSLPILSKLKMIDISNCSITNATVENLREVLGPNPSLTVFFLFFFLFLILFLIFYSFFSIFIFFIVLFHFSSFIFYVLGHIWSLFVFLIIINHDNRNWIWKDATNWKNQRRPLYNSGFLIWQTHLQVVDRFYGEVTTTNKYKTILITIITIIITINNQSWFKGNFLNFIFQFVNSSNIRFNHFYVIRLVPPTWKQYYLYY